MNIFECLRISWRALISNKMRTALTMLGIIIGVGVVILVVAIGKGAAQRVAEQVNSLGTNLLSIWPGNSRVRVTAASRTPSTGTNTSGGSTAAAAQSQMSRSRLTLEDAKQLAARFPKTIDAVSPQVRDNVQIRSGNTDSTTNLQGVSLDYLYVNNANLSRGRYFNQVEMDGNLKVCVVGQTIAEKLTGDPNTNLVGQTISINKQDFEIVGMLKPKGSGAWGQDQDDIILAPITTAMRRIMNRQYINFIGVRCVSPEMMPLAMEQISNFLRNRHNLQPPFPENDDFNIRSQTELMESQQSVTGTMTTLLSAVAIISLIVGGIGIMNIMLVSVTERTREIGIRKAIGATPRDILMQFLIESAIIALIGGLIGIGVGVGGAHALATFAEWTTIVDQTAVVTALVVSCAIGLFFGIYPASKAAKLHPIEALRFE